SRRRHTRSTRDWSSDVCSSDLVEHATADADALFDEVDLEAIEVDLGHDRDGDPVGSSHEGERAGDDLIEREGDLEDVVGPALVRSEERRVGNKCRTRGVTVRSE